MDAKSKADFINSIAAGRIIPCPECGAENEAGSNFCYLCGWKLAGTEAADISAFEPVAAQTHQESGEYIEVDDEPVSAFAKGLPDWDIVPPQIVIRGRKTK